MIATLPNLHVSRIDGAECGHSVLESYIKKIRQRTKPRIDFDERMREVYLANASLISKYRVVYASNLVWVISNNLEGFRERRVDKCPMLGKSGTGSSWAFYQG